jgi:hypothetical protein
VLGFKKFFHVIEGGKSYNIKHKNGWVTDHDEKEGIIRNHFKYNIRRGERRMQNYNWSKLNLDNPNLDELGEAFIEEDIRNTINQMPSDKAPGPDWFTRVFFKKCWDIIKFDTSIE